MSDILVFILHGHVSNSEKPRFKKLSEVLEDAGLDSVRFSIKREEIGPQKFLVPTIEEEVQQVTKKLQELRSEYNIIVGIGHSQGSLVLSHAAAKGHVDAIVFLMSVFEMPLHVKTMTKRLNENSGEFSYDDQTYVYTQEFIDSLESQEPLQLVSSYDAPKLFFAGTKDVRVPLKEVQKGFMTATGPKHFIKLDTAHNFEVDVATQIAEKILVWLKRIGLI